MPSVESIGDFMTVSNNNHAHEISVNNLKSNDSFEFKFLFIKPVGKNGPEEILKHVSSMYGTKARVEPTGDLLKTMCPSK